MANPAVTYEPMPIPISTVYPYTVEFEVLTLTVSIWTVSAPQDSSKKTALTQERRADECESTSYDIPWHVVPKLGHQSTVHEGKEHDHEDKGQNPDSRFQGTVALQSISASASQEKTFPDLPL